MYFARLHYVIEFLQLYLAFSVIKLNVFIFVWMYLLSCTQCALSQLSTLHYISLAVGHGTPAFYKTFYLYIYSMVTIRSEAAKRGPPQRKGYD